MKKAVTFLMVFILAMSSFGANVNSLISTVSTSAGSWTSPGTGMKYNYGGDYQFTFNGGNRFQPWITTSKPSLKVGCNGISLKGGFVGLLGLNEIKDQLSDSGASLAWGVMIGLQYSMPALFSVFKTLREWATTIQKLLQNMCSIGQSLVRNTDTGKAAKKDVDDFLNTLGSAGDWMDSKMKGADEYRKNIDKYVDCSSLSGDAYKKCVGKLGNTKVTQNDKIAHSVGSNTGSVAILMEQHQVPEKSPSKLYVGKLSDLLDSGKIQDQTIISSTALHDKELSYKLLRVFFGDIVLTNTTFSKIVTKNTNYEKSPDTGTYEIDINKKKEQIKKDVDGEPKKPSDKEAYFAYEQPIITDHKLAANALINGITSSVNSSFCNANECDISEELVFYSDFGTPQGGDTEDRSVSYGIVKYPSLEKADTSLQWDGALKESLKSIRTLVKSKSGITPVILTHLETDNNLLTANSTSTTIPLLLPNIAKYIDIVSSLERRAGRETQLSAHLKELLAENNAYFVAKSLIDLIYAKVIDAQGSPYGGGLSSKDMASFNKNIMEIKREITNELLRTMDANKKFQELDQIFTQLNKELKNTVSKGL